MELGMNQKRRMSEIAKFFLRVSKRLIWVFEYKFMNSVKKATVVAFMVDKFSNND
jgi:hypothetical protein